MGTPAGLLRTLPRCHLAAALLPPSAYSTLRREAAGLSSGATPLPFALLAATLPDGAVALLPWFHAHARRMLSVGNTGKVARGGGGEEGAPTQRAATRQWLATRGVHQLARWDRRDATRTGLLLCPAAPQAQQDEAGAGAAVQQQQPSPCATRIALLCAAHTPLSRAFALAAVGSGSRFALHFVPLHTWGGDFTGRARLALREARKRDAGED
jgi:hypothetical protein